MPADFELDMLERTVRSRGWGVVTDDDLFNHLEQITALFDQGIVDSTWAQVADFSAAERFDQVSPEGIRRMAACNPWPNASLRAIVLPSDLGFGLGRMYEMLCGAGGENVCVVRSEADALAWMSHRRGPMQFTSRGDETVGSNNASSQRR